MIWMAPRVTANGISVQIPALPASTSASHGRDLASCEPLDGRAAPGDYDRLMTDFEGLLREHHLPRPGR